MFFSPGSKIAGGCAAATGGGLEVVEGKGKVV
jgi:hypothetical protein